MNLQQMAELAVKQALAEDEAARRASPPTPQQQLEAELNAAQFRERIGDQALAAGVRPSAVRHVVRDAGGVFELRDGALHPRNGATDPGDPLSPLTPKRWLEQLAATDGYLFEPGRIH